MRYIFYLILFFLPTLLPAQQNCDCCTVRDNGQNKYDQRDYKGAISSWENAKKMPDAATKCTDLDRLIQQARKKLNPAKPPQPKKQTPPPSPPTKTAAQQADDEAWDIAQGNLRGCQRYLDKYRARNGRHVAEAEQCVQDESDDDNDGVLNKNDQCRKVKGSAPSGCPPPPTPVTTPDISIPSPVAHGRKSGLRLMPVTGGSFTMGPPTGESGREADECEHRATVKDFAMGIYEVTQADWQEVMGTNPSNFKDCPECPVENVSWNDVQEFIQKSNQKYHRTFRLPTETEWEFAARGGIKSTFYQRFAGTDNTSELYQYANFCDSKCTYSWAEKTQTDEYTNTAPVGTFKPNALGLYDMSGNVWEWCQDMYGPYPGCSEPTETDSSRRVLRGGSWIHYSYVCRSGVRGRNFVTVRVSSIGFRLAQD